MFQPVLQPKCFLACTALVLFFSACTLQEADPGRAFTTVHLHGVIHHPGADPILLELPDPLAYDQPLVLDTLRLDSAGRFSLAFTWNEPGHARINVGEYFIPLYLMPADSMYVEYELELDEATFTGRGAAVNNYLQALEGVNEQFTLYANLPMEEYIARLDSLTAARTALLDELRPQALAEHHDHPFPELARAEIEASRLEDLQQYPFLFKYVTNAEQAPELPAELRTSIEQFPLNNDAWFGSRAYQSFVDARFSDLIRDTLKQQRAVYEERHYRFADSLLTGRMRELQLARVVQKAFTYGSGLASGEAFLERYKAAHPASRYMPYLQGLYERAASVAVGRPAKPFTAVDLDGNAVTLDDLRGQPVYLDIWASWCLPCRKSIPDILQLTKDMKDQPVQVVMLSVDDDEASWRKLAEQHPGPRHLLVQGGLSNAFSKDYNLSGVPKYFLLDRQGVILDNNGPYPKEAKEKLEALLKES
jgi:thiol-disulfide isomerase/thioredoxin